MVGEGASGIVYQVFNTVTGRLEAMKVLAGNVSQDLEQVQRFLREIQLQAKLDHPNIAQVRTAFCEGQTLVLIMEMVEGESLSSVLSRGPLPLAPALRIADQVLSALEYAHHKGVIHRDIKPANILIDRGGAVKLADFGLAKQQNDPGQTNPGIAVGTVFYMPPEQIHGMSHIDWRADIYAVGVLLYEMLTGRRPFDGPQHFSVMRAHVELDPVPASRLAANVPEAVDRVIVRALQKDPRCRYQSAGEFRRAIRSVVQMPRSSKAHARNIPVFHWQYATYAVGLGALLLSAVAAPPWLPGMPVETLDLRLPAAPSAPPVEFFAPVPSMESGMEALPVPVRSRTPAGTHRAPIRSAAERAENPAAEAPEPLRPALTAPVPPLAEPGPTGVSAPPPLPLPNRSPAAIPEGEAVLAPSPLPAAKPGWMRRTLTRLPRVFRKADKSQMKP